jgi:hypothetical protein
MPRPHAEFVTGRLAAGRTKEQHMNSIRAITTCSGLAAVAVAGIVLAPSASAKGLEVRKSGDCSQASTWQLKAKADNGRIETEFEVDSNVVGQTWSVRLLDNGTKVAAGKPTTVAPSGSFTFRRIIANMPGSDTITAIATQAGTGETCRARLVFPG